MHTYTADSAASKVEAPDYARRHAISTVSYGYPHRQGWTVKGVVSGLDLGYSVWCRDVSGTYLIAPVDLKAFNWTRSGNTIPLCESRSVGLHNLDFRGCLDYYVVWKLYGRGR